MSRGFQIPGECQGQIVEVAYACAGDRIIRRTHDRSDGEISYDVAPILSRDWRWYETWCTANGAPPIPGSRWRRLSAESAAALIDER